MKMNKMVILMGISALIAGMASDCLAAKKKTTKAKSKTTAKSKAKPVAPKNTTAKAKPVAPITLPLAPAAAPAVKMTITAANINTQDAHGNIPLNSAIASSKGSTTTVAALLGIPGVQINAMDKAGFTPLMTAASRGYTDIVNLLISKGANTKLTRNGTPNGQTALSLTPKKYTAIITLLSK